MQAMMLRQQCVTYMIVMHFFWCIRRVYAGRAGKGRAGQGRAGQGRAGQGRAGLLTFAQKHMPHLSTSHKFCCEYYRNLTVMVSKRLFSYLYDMAHWGVPSPPMGAGTCQLVSQSKVSR